MNHLQKNLRSNNLNILIFNWCEFKNPAAGGVDVFTHENAKYLATIILKIPIILRGVY